MEIGKETLSNITIFSKYAKYLPNKKRRETWDEIVRRYEKMMIEKYPKLSKEIKENCSLIKERKVLPSMRCLQFAGLAMEVNNARGYNCAYLPIESVYSFSETMFLLLGGTGVGFSVQKHHIEQLPVIQKVGKNRHYLIEDSIIGWADSVKVLMKAYLQGKFMPVFDFRAIRPKGARLITAGGKAPGPEPLKICLIHIQAILDRKQEGERLSSLECHDIICHIANSVLAGGIRRSACLSLFSYDDKEMLTCKYGNWYELNEQRGRANNSVVLERGKITEEQFLDIWKRIEASGSGEPGIYWTNNRDLGCNPCAEISLRPYQFCNLSEVNVDDVVSQEDLNKRVEIASFFGTLQSGFTDFHYLRPIWQRTTEKESLLGVGMTGIASGNVEKYNLSDAAKVAVDTNIFTAATIGINPAARVTTIKPSGTTSLVLGTSSGIHAWYSKYYLRTIRFNKNEDIAIYLMTHHPKLCEDDVLRPHDTLCVRIPVKAPQGAMLRTESAISMLERVKKFHEEWITPGHVSGENTHNVSATVYINPKNYYTHEYDFRQDKDGKWIESWECWENANPDDPLYKQPYGGFITEWGAVGEWMWKNKEFYNGLSVLPYFGGSYKQAPFEEINEEEYDERISHLKNINLTKIIENDDHVEFTQVSACSGGACEINI